MRRSIRWSLLAAGALLLAWGGVSIFSRPQREILYQTEGPNSTCVKAGCYALYTLQVGNTGDEVEPEVRLRFHDAALQRALMRPTVRAFGKVDRPAAVRKRGGERVYVLETVAPGERVEVSFVFRYDAGASPPAWEDLFLGAEAEAGNVKRGDPATITFARILYSLFGHL